MNPDTIDFFSTSDSVSVLRSIHQRTGVISIKWPKHQLTESIEVPNESLLDSCGIPSADLGDKVAVLLLRDQFPLN